MTEAEWWACTDPQQMLTWLLPTRSGDMPPSAFEGARALSPRKLRLFACACARTFLRQPSPVSSSYDLVEECDGTWDSWIPSPLKLALQWCGPNITGDLPTKAALLRCLCGNPFRWPPLLGYHVLRACDDERVQAVARAIYDHHRWDDLPILADALEEAGCQDPDILSHARGPGPHARGCWLIDLLLGKE
jgi:hypothetical protein